VIYLISEGTISPKQNGIVGSSIFPQLQVRPTHFYEQVLLLGKIRQMVLLGYRLLQGANQLPYTCQHRIGNLLEEKGHSYLAKYHFVKVITNVMWYVNKFDNAPSINHFLWAVEVRKLLIRRDLNLFTPLDLIASGTLTYQMQNSWQNHF